MKRQASSAEKATNLKTRVRFFLGNLLVTACAALALITIFEGQCIAQVGTTARGTGAVTDQSGAAVTGATVTIREVDTNALRTITTSDNGNYVLTQLTAGTYIL